MLLTASIVYHIVFCLSSTFFKFFNFLFSLNYLELQPIICSCLFLVFNSFDILSCIRLFVKYFFCFFQYRLTFTFSVRCRSTFSIAFVFYHTVFCLSRSFLSFSNYLFCLNFQNNSFICFVSNSSVSITLLFLFVNYFFHLFSTKR